MAADIPNLPAVNTDLVINDDSSMDFTFSVLPGDAGQANTVVTSIHFLWQDENMLLTTLNSKVSADPSLSGVTLTGVSLENVLQVTELAVTPSATRTSVSTTRTGTSGRTTSVTTVTTSLVSE